MKKYLFSVCILTLNHLEYTKECLLTLVKTEFIDRTEIIIVDNNSTDGTQEWLQDFQKKYNSDCLSIVLIFNRENRGCTGGRNQACKIATGEFVIILDNDTEIINKNWLVELLQFYQNQGPDIGIVGPKMLYKQNPTIIQQIGLGVTQNGRIGYWGQGAKRNDPRYNYPRELQGYPAACWLLKRELFNEVGYFDESYYPVNLEDVDFCYRIRQKGYKVVYCPNVELFHSEHITTRGTEGLSFIRVTLKNSQLFKKRWQHIYKKEEGMKDEDIYWVQ